MSDNTISPWSCPVCFDVPIQKIFQCRRGHSICAECKFRQFNCPECQIPYKHGVTRNLALESILDKLSLDCPHKELGCGQKMGRGQIPLHATTCNFRPRPRKRVKICKAMGFNHCNFSVIVGPSEDELVEIRDHFTNVHKYKLWTNDGKEAISYVIGGFGRLLEMDRIWRPLLVKTTEARNAPTFLIYPTYSKEDETLSWNNIFLGGDMTSDWHADFVVYDQAPPDRNTIKNFKWKVPAVGVAEAEDVIKSRPMRLSVQYLLQFYLEVLQMKLRMRPNVPTQDDMDSVMIIRGGSSFFTFWMPMKAFNKTGILDVSKVGVMSY